MAGPCARHVTNVKATATSEEGKTAGARSGAAPCVVARGPERLQCERLQVRNPKEKTKLQADCKGSYTTGCSYYKRCHLLRTYYVPGALYLSPLILVITPSIHYVLCSPSSADEGKSLGAVTFLPPSPSKVM